MKILLFLILNIFKLTLSISTKCKEIIKNNRKDIKELKNKISANMFDLKGDLDCLDYLITKDMSDAAEHFMLELSKRGVKFRDTVKLVTQRKINMSREIYNNYRFDENDFHTVFPAFQWAQNTEYIYLQIKYAHRFDAPGCIEARNEMITINGSLFDFHAFCHQGESPIKIHLHLNLFNEIDKEGSTHISNSVGRYEVKLKKKSKAYWKRLLNPEFESPKNMKMWLEMREKYLEDIQKYIDQNENDEDNKIQDEINEKKKKKIESTDDDNDEKTVHLDDL